MRQILIACSSCMALAAPAWAQIEGTWTGTYTCAQGETAFELDLAAEGGTHWSGSFAFFQAEGGPAVPRGSYAVEVIEANGTYFILPNGWIERPEGFFTIQMSFRPDAAGDAFTGEVAYPLCGAITGTRAAPDTPSAPDAAPGPDAAPAPGKI